jgi:hypothetical protein
VLRAEPAAEPGRGVVGVDVADGPGLVEREGGDDRDPAVDQEGVEQRPSHVHDRGNQALAGGPFGDQEAAVDTGEADGVRATSAQGGHERRIDGAPQDRRHDLDGSLVGHPQAVLEMGRHAEPRQPLRDLDATAVHDDHRSTAGEHGDLGQDRGLACDGRAAELDDGELAHVE